MALSFNSVQKAYEVFNQIKKIIPLGIGAFPEDMEEWPDENKTNPPLNQVYGWGRKYDNGWESICFFVENPTEELKEKFNELKDTVPNSSICKPYFRNESIWCFGWF
jgi:hypothetical protein